MRRGGVQTDSYDMLLDTICNTFGGVVFIALLLALFAPSDTKSQQEEKDELLQELANTELIQQIERNEREIASLEARKNDILERNDPTLSAAAALALSNMTSRVWADALTEQVEAIRQDVDALKEASDMAQAAAKENAATLKKLRSETLSGTQTRRLPRLQPIEGLIPLFLIIADKQLYVLSTLSGNTARLDTEVTEVEEHNKITVVTPRSGTGQRINEDAIHGGRFGRLISTAPPSRFFFQIAVDRRSFDQFDMVKHALLKSGHRYYWLIQEGPVTIVQANTLEAM